MTRILIVDDEPEEARALARQFSALAPGLTVFTTTSGKDAIELLERRDVELVLTDLRMPELDGVQLLAWLHQHRPNVAAFTMSAYGTDAEAATLGSLGAIDHFPKPVDVATVLKSFTDTLHQTVRGYVQHVSLASFLQLLEMERKTCSLTVTCAEKTGYLAVRDGALVGARAGELEGQAAAIAIVAWPYPNIAISRRCEETGEAFSSSLGFIVMEAMRTQDEAARQAEASRPQASAWPAAHRTWRPSALVAENGKGEPSAPRNGEAITLFSGAQALAVVETETGNVVYSASRNDCPVGELARLASQLLLQESATLRLCSEGEGVEELVLSTSSRCDVIRPLTEREFALLVFAPEETNLVMARLELEYFIAAQGRGS